MKDWNIKDKHWMAQRKNEWLLVREILERTLLTKKEIKQVEKYFLKGKDSEEVLFVFKLWFHPDDSDENWQKLRDEVTSSNFIDSRNLYKQSLINPSYQNEAMKIYGYMGDKEKRIFDVLFRSGDEQDVYRFINNEGYYDKASVILESNIFNFAYLSSMLFAWLRTDKPNTHCVIQFMVEDWYNLFREAIGGDPRFVRILKLIYIRKHQDTSLAKKLDLELYDYELPELEGYRLTTAKQLYNILEQRPIPSELVPVWENIKHQAEK